VFCRRRTVSYFDVPSRRSLEFRECDSGTTLNEGVRSSEPIELSSEIIHPQR
jgi:hypothetical protein